MSPQIEFFLENGELIADHPGGMVEMQDLAVSNSPADIH
jgi:hypothetical protein